MRGGSATAPKKRRSRSRSLPRCDGRAPLPRLHGRGSLLDMSTQIELDPKQLRPLLHAEIDKLRDEDLIAAHRALLAIEARRLADELGETLDEGWASGRITKDSIAEAIREHRRKHPYH